MARHTGGELAGARAQGRFVSVSEQGVIEAIIDAHAARAPVRIVGGGTWLDGGRPVPATQQVSVRELSTVIAYVPGDLVITVGAGMTLTEIAEITADHRQWLALDPPGINDATIGAVVATASSGPLALGAGRVRDLVLGVTCIAADGTPVRAGGRVVKNVAGFDLVRLATGSFGTLGAITEVSVRLHARPEVDETYETILDDPGVLSELPAKLGLSALGFLSLELLHIAEAQWTVLARVSGNRARVDAQRAFLGALGTSREVPGIVWRSIRATQHGLGDGGLSVRVADAPAKLGNTIVGVERALASLGVHGGRVRATPHTGVVRIAIAESALSAGVATRLVVALEKVGASTVCEQLPLDAWAAVPPAAADLVSQRIRDAFDPHRIFNRGIFGEHAAERAAAHVGRATAVVS